MADRNVTKPLVVTDENLVKLGIAEHVFAPLKEADIDYVVYDKVPPDSSLTVVNEVAELYRSQGCDGWIALGGGSAIDTAKGAAAAVSVGEKDFTELQGSEILQDDLDTLIAIPTTAGTGSEVTLVAVVADTKAHAKLSYTSISSCATLSFSRSATYRFPATKTHCNYGHRCSYPCNRSVHIYSEKTLSAML